MSDANCKMDQWPGDPLAFWRDVLIAVCIVVVGVVVVLAVTCGGGK